MIQAVFGLKVDQSQKFLEDGTRIPVTLVACQPNIVIGFRNLDKHGYSAVELGIGERKKATKSKKGLPLFLREVRFESESVEQMPKVGDKILASDVLKPGDIVDVTGVSKGKGFAGVVKRHHFKGGPRTHGQSDRERAPGSIGQSTTPGRVYKGKRMAGRMGHENVTIKNLQIVSVADTELLVKGLVPGIKNSLVMIKKVGESKKFVPLYQGETEEARSTSSGQAKETKGTNEEVSKVGEVPKVSKEETKTEEKVKEEENANK